MAYPKWWSTKGGKMEIGGLILQQGHEPILNITNGSVARVTITRRSRRADYNVDCEIKHCDGSQTSGTVLMDRSDLAKAFGLVNGFGEGGPALTYPELGYGYPDAAAQGKYFRIKDYLNIPHPGTGLQGDPNISVEITPEIKSAIQSFLDFTAAKAA